MWFRRRKSARPGEAVVATPIGAEPEGWADPSVLAPPPDEGEVRILGRVGRDAAAPVAPTTTVTAAVTVTASAEVAAAPAMRIERYVAALAVHAQQLEDRIRELEKQQAVVADTIDDRPDHADLLEVRLHSSRVSADLGRLALELRAEVAEIKDEADRRAAPVAGVDLSGVARDPERLVQLAERLLELADDLDAQRRTA